MTGWLLFVLVIVLSLGVLFASLGLFRFAAKPLSRWSSTRTWSLGEGGYSPRLVRMLWVGSLLEAGMGGYALGTGRLMMGSLFTMLSASLAVQAFAAAKRAKRVEARRT
ncbi:MAG: hypothetical protein M0Z87_05270 [Actinomycetota bacterium]|nr:hypothetical protein [Actinomycetota bacterium]